MTVMCSVVDRWCCHTWLWSRSVSRARFEWQTGCSAFWSICANCDTKRVNKTTKLKTPSVDAARTSHDNGQKKSDDIRRHQNKLTTHINYVAEHSGKANTHKIHNKQHEDCARQYLNAINKREKAKPTQHQSCRFERALKFGRVKNNTRTLKLDRPSSEWNTMYARTTETKNRLIHHPACVRHHKGVTTGPNKTVSLLHFQTSVRFCLAFLQSTSRPIVRLIVLIDTIERVTKISWKREKTFQKSKMFKHIKNCLMNRTFFEVLFFAHNDYTVYLAATKNVWHLDILR